VYTGRLSPKGDAGEQVKTVVSRGLAQTPTITAAPVTHTQSATSLDTADTQDLVGYFEFSLSITEYCEASEGTPLKARGWWSVKGSNDGMKVWFGGDQVTHMSLGYPPFSLQVGPCKPVSLFCDENRANHPCYKDDFYARRVNFHYGGCHWDQDTNGIGDCGYCTSSPWSAPGLNCAMNAAAGRVCHDHRTEGSMLTCNRLTRSIARSRLSVRKETRQTNLSCSMHATQTPRSRSGPP
jgi:hypothetical protein